MSAQEAVKARALHDWQVYLQAALDAKGMTRQELGVAVWGMPASGKFHRSSDLASFINAQHNAQPATVKRFADALGVSAGEMDAMFRPAFNRGYKVYKKAGRPPGSVNLFKHARPTTVAEIEPDEPDLPEQFSLVIDQKGVATLRLNLIGVPMQTAMRAVAALTSIGILNNGEATQ